MKKLFLLVLLASNFCYAGGHTGGGKLKESDLKYLLGNLAIYFKSEEALELFPEVRDFNKNNPKESFDQILEGLNPHLVTTSVFDSQGNERDCISGEEDSVRFFKCNQNALPQNINELENGSLRAEYFGGLYRFLLHEGFVQIGLEAALSKEVPSDYRRASRLPVHLKSFPEWVPGRDPNLVVMDFSGTKLECILENSSHPNLRSVVKGEIVKDCSYRRPGASTPCNFNIQNSYSGPSDDPKTLLSNTDQRNRIQLYFEFGVWVGWPSEKSWVGIRTVVSNSVLSFLRDKGRLDELTDSQSLLFNATRNFTRLSTLLEGVSISVAVPYLHEGKLLFGRELLSCQGKVTSTSM